MSNKFIFCLDGGASSSIGVPIDKNGNLIDVLKGPPLAAVQSKKQIKKSLISIFKNLTKTKSINIDNCELVSLGIAGTPYLMTRELKTKIKNIFKEENLEFDTLINSDMPTIWAGATCMSEGVSVYAGTGSNAYGKNTDGETTGVDYMGSLIGDKGGGYYIGVRALQAVAESLDGRGPTTALEKEAFKMYNLEDEGDFFRYDWRSLTRREIAKFSKCVDEISNFDKVAEEILVDSGKKLGHYGKTAIRNLNPDKVNSVYYSGGVFNSKILLDSFRSFLKEDFDVVIRRARFSPVVGCFFLACKRLSIPIEEDLIKNLEKGCKEIKKA